MTDDEIRAWLTQEIERERLHTERPHLSENVVRHCAGRMAAASELLAILNRATRPNLWARAMGAK